MHFKTSEPSKQIFFEDKQKSKLRRVDKFQNYVKYLHIYWLILQAIYIKIFNLSMKTIKIPVWTFYSQIYQKTGEKDLKTTKKYTKTLPIPFSYKQDFLDHVHGYARWARARGDFLDK